MTPTRAEVCAAAIADAFAEDGEIFAIPMGLLPTLGACGDVERNVMACPAPHRHDGVHEELQAAAARLAAHLAPRTGAYHEIWLNGKALHTAGKNGDAAPAAHGLEGAGEQPEAVGQRARLLELAARVDVEPVVAHPEVLRSHDGPLGSEAAAVGPAE